ncbi:MAG: SDR family NAD(P)-dependent oxidoreductase [bacterium]|nr:SDR family NAD(P)-dependent oxidoreductase [bacterium]MCY4163758.1 SDR family NAD(P)-dependent oxidoreductase [bacterium]
MPFSIDGSVAVVTGATRGIGRQIAFRLGRSGAKLVVVGRTGADHPDALLPGSLPEVVAALAEEGIEACSVQADLTSSDDIARIVADTLEWHGGCDILVNNAAYTSNGPIIEVPWARWEKGFRVQVVGPMQLCQGLVPKMLERGTGRVLSVSSGASLSLSHNLALYSTTKQAMERWSEYMHLELGGQGVTFNVLRVDSIVSTEGWWHVYNTQGEDIATGGNGLDTLQTPEYAATCAEWMIRQPDDWSGHSTGFKDIEALGGP